MASKINLKYGYSVTIHEDDTLTIVTTDKDGESIEFDGIKGNLMDASDFETHYTDENIEYTVAEYKETSLSFLTDWGIEAEVAESIVKELTPWFERYAISEEESTAKRIEELNSWIQHRRESVKNCVKSIDNCRHEISVYEQRIGYEVSEILKLNEDIEDITRQIAELKASLKGEKFISIEPCYTGGGVYVFTGQMTDGNFFMADTSFFDVRIVNDDPNRPAPSDETILDEDAWADVEWQEEHLVKDLDPTETVAFFRQMLKWVAENEPNGNYNMGDMEDITAELDTLKGDWR